MQRTETYRVVGVCPDQSRMVICGGLQQCEAESLKRSLPLGRAFESIEVEEDDQPVPSPKLKPVATAAAPAARE